MSSKRTPAREVLMISLITKEILTTADRLIRTFLVRILHRFHHYCKSEPQSFSGWGSFASRHPLPTWPSCHKGYPDFLVHEVSENTIGRIKNFRLATEVLFKGESASQHWIVKEELKLAIKKSEGLPDGNDRWIV